MTALRWLTRRDWQRAHLFADGDRLAMCRCARRDTGDPHLTPLIPEDPSRHHMRCSRCVQTRDERAHHGS